jgi:hypothetical protein
VAAQGAFGQHEARLHAVEFGLGNQVRRAVPVVVQDLAELLLDGVDERPALGLDEDLDARLVQVVAAAVAVVDAHDRLDEDEDLLPGQELAHERADHRRPAHAAAHQHREADLALCVPAQVQTDVVPGDRGAVLGGAGHGDLELARQEGELGVQRAPLAQHFAVRPRIHRLVGGDAGQRVAGDVADAVAAGLDAVHVDCGQPVHHIRAAGQRDPVELQVLARGEVAVAAVELARDAGQLAQLAGVDLAVGHRDAQHRRMALHVPAVLQAKRAELVVAEPAGEVALELVAVLCSALLHEAAVEVGVLVHVSGSPSSPRSPAPRTASHAPASRASFA